MHADEDTCVLHDHSMQTIHGMSVNIRNNFVLIILYKCITYAPSMVQHSHDSVNLRDLIQIGGKSTQHYQIESMRSVRHRKQLAW